jgi:hypothetical protein
MKKILLSALLLMMVCSLFSQTPTIDDPSSKSTITTQQIIENQQYRGTHSGGANVLYFEGLGNRDLINSYYDGGLSQQGFTGPDYGIVCENLRGVIDSDDGGTGNFANEPSPNTIMYYMEVFRAQMNIADGFTEGIAFYYTSSVRSWVGIYDGLDGTGNLLNSIYIHSTNPGLTGGDPSGYYDSWLPISLPISGTGRSVVFYAGADAVGFDNFTIGSTALPAVAVPLPNWALLIGIGLIFIFVTLRFFRIYRA